MKRIANWRLVFRRAWTVRLIALSVLLGLLAALVEFAPAIIPMPIWAQFALALASPVVGVAAFIARFIAQRNLANVDP